jgi:hypothetical protein
VAVNAARSDPPTPRAQARARRSWGNRSGRRGRRSGGSGAGSREMKSSGCASSRDSLPRRRRSTRRWRKKRKRKVTGGRPPERWEPAPPHRKPRRRRRNKHLGGHGSARRWAVYGRGGVRRGGVWRHDSGGDDSGLSARRALEEEEAGLLHIEVGHRPSRHSVSRAVSLIFLISRSQGGTDCPPPPCACEGA